MTDRRDLLLEVGTEELPPGELAALSDALAENLATGLEKEGLEHGPVARFASPRRLAVRIEQVVTSQPERLVERRGPALAHAFDAQGRPTRAALGFARSCGVSVEELDRLETARGAWLVFRSTEKAQFTVSLLPGIAAEALAGLPARRRMRWAADDIEFVRPVHWVVLLFGDAPVEAKVLGVTAGSLTRGHRFHHPGPLALESPGAYEDLLREEGRVIARVEERRELVERLIRAEAQRLGGHPVIDPPLLAEVTAMVEWPVAIGGSFDEEFLALPRRVLTATMQGHQRYFPVEDAGGALTRHFITVANIESRDPAQIRAGNERVIRPRLKDAAFFFETDLRTPLAERLEELEEVVFQDELGSLADKSRRVSTLARHVAAAMGCSPEEVRQAGRAGLLAKCDLVTGMVGEFPELQGYMGHQYALRHGEPPGVAAALEEAYLPRHAGDELPASPVGAAVAIADRLDTLVGIFGVGLLPRGDRDPFGLRRAALGVLRILIEREIDLELMRLIRVAVAEYGELVEAGPPGGSDEEQAPLAERVHAFALERLRAYFGEQGIATDVFNAVAARRPGRPLDFARRVRAVAHFRELPEAESLAAANKRIKNILRQAREQGESIPSRVDEGLLREDAEWNLAAKLVGLAPRVNELLRGARYEEALTHLAGLREAVDRFFEDVKVMDEDPAVRGNRLALLRSLERLFGQTADISELHPGGRD